MIHRGSRARRDPVNHHEFLENSTAGLGTRFLAAARDVFKKLEEMPMMGHHWRATERDLKDVLVWPIVPKFDRYLIFYRPIENGIQVLGVIHSAQDIDELMIEEE